VGVPFPASVRGQPKVGGEIADFDGICIHLNVKSLCVLWGGIGKDINLLSSLIPATQYASALIDLAFSLFPLCDNGLQCR
jgi:hypothetical protein